MDAAKFFNTLDSLFAEKKTGEAEAYMQGCLKEAEESRDLPGIVTVCNELGGFYRYTSRCGEAVSLYDKALSIIESVGQAGTPACGTTLINYATTCNMMGDFEKALNLYGQAADIFSGPQFAADFNLATLYNNMSLVCQNLGDAAKAETYLLKALEILKGLSESDIEIAITYTNLSLLYMAGGRLEEAEGFLTKALKLYDDNGAESDVHYAATVSALGELYFTKKDYAKAADAFEKALAMNIRDYGEGTDSSKTIAANLALCREKLQEAAGSAGQNSAAQGSASEDSGAQDCATQGKAAECSQWTGEVPGSTPEETV